MIRSLISQLAVLSAVCASVLVICPDTAVKKYVKLACSLCVLSLLISFLPFDFGVPEIGIVSVSVTDLSNDAKRMIAEQTAARVSEAVRELAYDKYGIDGNDIKINISYKERDDGVAELTKAKIELYGLEYSLFTVELKNSVKELLGIPCEVVIIE